jgi:CBS domain-containing protein
MESKEGRGPQVVSKILVKDIMNSPVITAAPDANARELAERMSKANVGSVVITEDSKPLGIVTDRDIVARAATKDEAPSKILARDIMQPLYTIDGERLVTDAARLLRKHNTKRLGVTYNDKLEGMVSASDLIAVTPELVDVISEKASIIRGEFGRTPTNISGYCDECDEWSDYLQYTDGRFICDECRIATSPAEVPPEER